MTTFEVELKDSALLNLSDSDWALREFDLDDEDGLGLVEDQAREISLLKEIIVDLQAKLRGKR